MCFWRAWDAIVLALLLGFAAQRLGLSPIVGYLLAGVAIGSHTLGFVGDQELTHQLAEIGVILLMFGVGLKVSIQDLWASRDVAIAGSIVHTAASAALGFAVGLAFGMPAVEALVVGIAISVASTIVVLRDLEERHLLKERIGRICLGWLLVEDVLIVVAIVILPVLVEGLRAQSGPVDLAALARELVFTLAKIGAFVAAMLLIGARVFPWLIVRIAHTRSRELLSLGTLALALGIAYVAYTWFSASFALGAFLAGLALNGSRVSHRVAEDSLPLRDTFAVLFFVSIGMLFDPAAALAAPIKLAGLVAAVVAGKALLAVITAMALGLSWQRASVVGAALGQIGEFTFVLAGLGLTLGVMQAETFSLLLAAALISIALNPVLFRGAAYLRARARAATPAAS
jgi:CPA2 family monovalent cation:H+ antiporter-2